MIVIEQLMNMDLSKIVRVNSDAIYTMNHDFGINKPFW